jgi:transposase
MPPMSKVDLFAAIRRDSRAGLSVRALARKYQVSRRTVRSALTSAWPAPRKPMPPRPSKLDAFKPVIDDILRADLDAPHKQRHTVKRIYDRLIAEHDMHDVSYAVVVRAYVADRKPKIRVEAGRGPVNVFFPQTHRSGAEAEVDFGEVAINLRGELVTCTLFAFRLSFSGKAVHKIFASGGSEAFREGHVHAFTTLGGVPTGKIRYDNLKAAVAQVLGFTRQRVETARWTAFRSHFAVDPFYCQPGLQGAHEKGGVEGQIGWFRRNHLVPVPEVESFELLNAMVDAWDVADEARRIGSRAHTVGELFAICRGTGCSAEKRTAWLCR